MRRFLLQIIGMLAVISLVPFVAATTAAATPSSAYEASFDPDPTGDPYLDQQIPTDAGMPNGTILSSRPVNILPPLAWTASFATWQVWFKSTDAANLPIAALTTIMRPTNWNGGVVANNYAIDGDGLQCNMSYQLTHSVSLEIPDITRQLLGKGYAIVMTDYQGPHMAYGHGPTEGREVLDGVRAALSFPAAGLVGSPVAMTGYSGGAIATGWAAQLQPTYAPDLHMVGAAFGGTPADLSLLPATMDGKPPATGLFLMSALGISRVTPGALQLLSPLGVQLAQQFKNACFSTAVLGVIPLPAAALTTVPPYQTAVVQGIFASTKMGGLTPTMPIYMWHGAQDEWIPAAGAQALYRTWHDAGANVSLHTILGDHVTTAFCPGALEQIDRWMGR